MKIIISVILTLWFSQCISCLEVTILHSTPKAADAPIQSIRKPEKTPVQVIPIAPNASVASQEDLKNFLASFVQMVLETYEARGSEEQFLNKISENIKKLKKIEKEQVSKDVFKVWEAIAGDRNLNEYLSDGFKKAEERAMIFLEALAEHLKKNAKKYDKQFKDNQEKKDKQFQEDMKMVKKMMAKADGMLEDPKQIVDYQKKVEEELKESWTSGANAEQIVAFIEEEKVKVKEQYKQDKSTVKKALQGLWEKKVKKCLDKHIDEMHKEVQHIFGFAYEVLQQVQKNNEDALIKNDTSAIKKALKTYEEFLMKFDAKFVEQQAKQTEIEVDKMVDDILKEINPKVYLKSEEAKILEEQLKADIKAAFNDFNEYSPDQIAQAKELMAEIHKSVDQTEKDYIEDKQKTQEAETQLLLTIEDDQLREKALNEYKKITTQEFEKVLTNLEESIKKNQIPTTKEKLAENIYDQLQAIDEKKVLDEVAKQYEECKKAKEDSKQTKVYQKFFAKKQ